MREKFPRYLQAGGRRYELESVLKQDFFSVNVLYSDEDGVRHVLKLSDFRFVFGWFLRPLAILMSRHEYRLYQRLADVEGIPAVGPRYGWRGFFHTYIEGQTLAELDPVRESLADDFFDRLGAIVTACHAHGIFYADLNKRGNIIVDCNGRPWLIDFQVSLQFRDKGRHRLTRRLFTTLVREDIYHLYKHKRNFQPDRLTASEMLLAQRSRFGERFNRWFGRPFRRIKRTIYPAGSNDTIWYRWRRR